MSNGLPTKKTLGIPGLWVFLGSEGSHQEGWKETTHIMAAGGGVVVKSSLERRNPDKGYSLALSTTFVPGVVLSDFFPVGHND